MLETAAENLAHSIVGIGADVLYVKDLIRYTYRSSIFYHLDGDILLLY